MARRPLHGLPPGGDSSTLWVALVCLAAALAGFLALYGGGVK
jgi:hypothetical protein